MDNIILKILNPIENASPAGSNLRASLNNPHSLFSKLKEARRQARIYERQNSSWPETASLPYWQEVVDYSIDALTHQTKDLEIATWLIEGLLRINGFKGLTQGFKIARVIIENFWDILYPHADDENEEGTSIKIAAFSGLNGEISDGVLIAPLTLVTLSQGKSVTPFTLWHYQQACKLAAIPEIERREQHIKKGAHTLEEIQIAVQETEPCFFDDLKNDLKICLESLEKLQIVLDKKVEFFSPSCAKIKEQLQKNYNAITIVTKDILSPVELNIDCNQLLKNQIEINKNAFIKDDNDRKKICGNYDNNHINRKEILETLAFAAEFFQVNEPHSPLPYMLRRAIRWAETPLPELLSEWLDTAALDNVFRLTGIPQQQ